MRRQAGLPTPDEIDEDGNWIHDGEIRPYSDLWTNGQKDKDELS